MTKTLGDDDAFTETDQYFIDYSFRHSVNKNQTRQELQRMGYPDHLLRVSQIPALSSKGGGGAGKRGDVNTTMTEINRFFIRHSLQNSLDREQTIKDLRQMGLAVPRR